MKKRFEEFIGQLKETHFSLCDFVDFPKVDKNVAAISIKLNQLNYLIGKPDIPAAVKLLWDENSKVFSVLNILIAVRDKDKKKCVDENGNLVLLSDYFKSPESVVEFLNATGLSNVFQSQQVTNLVDYVYGVEVGLDTNARKNRSGHIMERIVGELFHVNNLNFEREVPSKRFPDIVRALGTDEKRFDFVVNTPETTYLVEANFYSGGGSKPNETARSYTNIGPKINSVPGYEFIWITDGHGWHKAKNKLEEAFLHIPRIYNLTTIYDFIDSCKG